MTVDPIGNLSVRQLSWLSSPLVYVWSDVLPVTIRGGAPPTRTSSTWMLRSAVESNSTPFPHHGLGALGLRTASTLAGGSAQCSSTP